MDNFRLYNNDGYAAVQNWLANFVLRKEFPGEKDGKLATIANLIVPMQAKEYE